MNSIIFLILMAGAAGVITAFLLWTDKGGPETHEIDSAELIRVLGGKP